MNKKIQIKLLACRCDLVGDPVVITRFDVSMSDSSGGNHIGLRITEDDSSGGILQDLFHLDDDVSAFCRIEFAGELIGESIISRVAVAGTVLRVRTVDVCLPVHVEEYFRIACLYSQDVGDEEVVFASGADAVKYVVVDVLQVDLDADLLSVRLGSFSKERKFSTAGVVDEVKGERLSVFFNDAVAICILPACFSQRYLACSGLYLFG